MSDATKLASLSPLAPLALLVASIAAPIAAPLAGCVASSADGPSAPGTVDEPPATATVTSAIGGPTCPDFGCGANSPTIADGVAFDELATDGTPDSHGIRIVAAKQGGRPVKLHVDRHTLTAIATDGSGVVFSHGGLVGTVVILAKAGTKYELQINAVDENSLGFWAGNAKEREIVPFYRILVRPPGGQPLTPICKLNVAETEPVWKAVEHSAIAFVGDRYDPIAKTVRDLQPGEPWFNLACAGTATAKLHLMRHTNAGAWTAGTWVPGSDVTAPTAPYHTKVPDRQTMLKLFAADYCGGGNAYTMDGQPLLWSVTAPPYTPPSGVPALVITSLGTMSPAGGSIEALWYEKGALCLDKPRRPDLWDGACSIPACGGPPGVVGWQSIAHAISANGP